jgi:hypothetical protein
MEKEKVEVRRIAACRDRLKTDKQMDPPLLTYPLLQVCS